MSTQHIKRTNKLGLAILIVGLAASANSPKPASAQTESSLPQAAPYSAIHVKVEAWGKDPNLPMLGGDLGEAVTWAMYTDEQYRVDFRKPASRGIYLGFNDKGSWVRNEDDRKVYIWNLKARSLSLGALDEKEVPLDLKNPSSHMKDVISIVTGHPRVSGTVTGPSNAGRNTPYIPPSVAGHGNAQYAGGGPAAPTFNSGAGTSSAGVGSSIQIKGSAASIASGVLTFTNDAGAQVSMKVVRPPNQTFGSPNAPQSSGSAGAWLAEDPTDKSAVITLNVTDNGTVSGTKMTGMAAEVMKRIMNKSK